MDWWRILGFLRNLYSTEAIPFLFSEIIEDVSLGGIQDSNKNSVVPFFEDEELFYVHQK